MSMGWRDGTAGYGRLSRWLHWLGALAVLALLALGLLMEWTIDFDDQTLYARLKYAHISLGATLAILLLARIAWRLYSGWPAWQGFRRWQAITAGLTQGLLLVLLLNQVVTGWLARWTARAWPGQEAAELPLFGVLQLPSPFATHRPELNERLEWLHDLGADWLPILLAVHLAGALWHWLTEPQLLRGRMLRSPAANRERVPD